MKAKERPVRVIVQDADTDEIIGLHEYPLTTDGELPFVPFQAGAVVHSSAVENFPIRPARRGFYQFVEQDAAIRGAGRTILLRVQSAAHMEAPLDLGRLILGKRTVTVKGDMELPGAETARAGRYWVVRDGNVPLGGFNGERGDTYSTVLRKTIELLKELDDEAADLNPPTVRVVSDG